MVKTFERVEKVLRSQPFGKLSLESLCSPVCDLPSTWLLKAISNNSRMPARCQSTTVLGVARRRGSFHLSQSFRNTTQNSLVGCVATFRAAGWRRERIAKREADRGSSNGGKPHTKRGQK